MKSFLFAALIAFMLAGCGAQTTGKDIETRNEFIFGDVYAPVTISPQLSTQSGDTEQDVTAPTEITTDGELILTPSAQLDKAAKGLADAKILAKAGELNAAKLGEQLGDAEESLAEVEKDLDGMIYEIRFHHTTFDPGHTKDGGKSLVLCPGDDRKDLKCAVGDVPIRFHGISEERASYWNMTESPTGDISCVDGGGKTYKYKSDKTINYGSCK